MTYDYCCCSVCREGIIWNDMSHPLAQMMLAEGHIDDDGYYTWCQKELIKKHQKLAEENSKDDGCK